MGNDGGSIPRRREVVKQKKREEKKENYENAKAKSTLCHLSKEPLREPIAICRLGNLYNKEEILKRLLEKNIPKACRHIRKLKDVKQISPQVKANDDNTLTIVCPLSQIEFNGFHRFLAIWTCGCVISEEAANELKLTDKCINCGITIDKKSDVISLNQTQDEQEAYLVIIDKLLKEEQEKKDKKKDSKNGKSKKRTERDDGNEEVKQGEEDLLKKKQKLEIGEVSDEVKAKMKESEAYKSLFISTYEEDKDRDFLCRNVHRGLR